MKEDYWSRTEQQAEMAEKRRWLAEEFRNPEVTDDDYAIVKEVTDDE